MKPTRIPLTLPFFATAAQAQPLHFEVGEDTTYINVMKSARPKLPAFAPLKPKAGYVRGWVKDSTGKPLQNARLGVRSTVAGGFYSGAQGKTDARGYYEIKVPWGSAHFYNAGYSINYAGGRAACGLHPADGELDSFVSEKGAVENFVLLPYGIVDAERVQDKPFYAANYFGGFVSFDWNVADENPTWADPTYLPPNSQIEITLTPTAKVWDGTSARAITVRKSIGTVFGRLAILNLPVTTYKLSAKVVGGKVLKMEEIGMNSEKPFGIEPKKSTQEVTLHLRPASAQAERAMAGLGNWDDVTVKLSR